MRKIWFVFTNEMVSVVARRSFLLTLFAVPLIGLLAFIVISRINDSEENTLLDELLAPSSAAAVEGYVDQAGIIAEVPADLQPSLVAFDDEAAAQHALMDKTIEAYYVIEPDYIESGRVTYVRSDYNPLGGLVDAQVIQQALVYNLFGADKNKTRRFEQPLVTSLVSPVDEGDAVTDNSSRLQPRRDPDNVMTFMLPYAVTFLLYFVIMGSASLMLNSVTAEKENRVLEILLTSTSPFQMLAGKMAALGLVGLLQTLLWGASGMLFLRLGGKHLDIPDVFQLQDELLLWAALFFLLGYVLYAALMAGIGALVGNMREASQMTFVVVSPLFLPLLLMSVLIQQPDGALALSLSLIPFTSPVVMMTRLAATQVPLWQVLLALVLLALAAWLALRLVAGMFKAQHMLSGQTASLKVFFRLLFSRA